MFKFNKIHHVFLFSLSLFLGLYNTNVLSKSVTSNIINENEIKSKIEIKNETENKSEANTPTEDFTKIENLDVVNKVETIAENCFPCDISEINLNEKLSSEEVSNISTEEGAILQYLIFKDDIKTSGIDTKQLSLNINNELKLYKDFFKNNPEYKGGFILLYTIIPIIDGEPVIKGVNKADEVLYKEIVEKIECKENSCSSELTIPASFSDISQYPQLLVKLKEYELTLLNQESKTPAIIKNLDYDKPINIYIMMGTNGFYITKELKEDFVTILNEIEDQDNKFK